MAITASPPDGRFGDRTYKLRIAALQTARCSVFSSSRQFSCRRTPPHGPRKGSDGQSVLRAAPEVKGRKARCQPRTPSSSASEPRICQRPHCSVDPRDKPEDDGGWNRPCGLRRAKRKEHPIPTPYAVILGLRAEDPEPRRRPSRNRIPDQAPPVRNDVGEAADAPSPIARVDTEEWNATPTLHPSPASVGGKTSTMYKSGNTEPGSTGPAEARCPTPSLPRLRGRDEGWGHRQGSCRRLFPPSSSGLSRGSAKACIALWILGTSPRMTEDGTGLRCSTLLGLPPLGPRTGSVSPSSFRLRAPAPRQRSR